MKHFEETLRSQKVVMLEHKDIDSQMVVAELRSALSAKGKELEKAQTENIPLTEKIDNKNLELIAKDRKILALKEKVKELELLNSDNITVIVTLSQLVLESDYRNAETQGAIAELKNMIAGKEKEIGLSEEKIVGLARHLDAEHNALILKDKHIVAVESELKVYEIRSLERIAELALLSRLLLESEDRLAVAKKSVDNVVIVSGGNAPTQEVAAAKSFLSPSERRRHERALIERSGLFDAKWYLNQNPDVAVYAGDPLDHYLDVGAEECRDPSPRFNTKRYLELNKAVKRKGGNPLLFYLGDKPSDRKTSGNEA